MREINRDCHTMWEVGQKQFEYHSFGGNWKLVPKSMKWPPPSNSFETIHISISSQCSVIIPLPVDSERLQSPPNIILSQTWIIIDSPTFSHNTNVIWCIGANCLKNFLQLSSPASNIHISASEIVFISHFIIISYQSDLFMDITHDFHSTSDIILLV